MIALFALSACSTAAPFSATPSPAAQPTPTVDLTIYNQVPKTTVFAPGQCTAVLNAPAPAHTSNTLASAPSAEIPPGKYEVGVAAQYSTSVWYALNGVTGPNYINSTSVSALEGDCTLKP